MNTLKKARQKLARQTGESITEVLVAVLISSLALVILAGMIRSSGSMVSRSQETMDRYIQQENNLATRTGASVAGTVTVKNSAGAAVKLTDSAQTQLPVRYFTNAELGGDPVVSYEGTGS